MDSITIQNVIIEIGDVGFTGNLTITKGTLDLLSWTVKTSIHIDQRPIALLPHLSGEHVIEIFQEMKDQRIVEDIRITDGDVVCDGLFRVSKINQNVDTLDTTLSGEGTLIFTRDKNTPPDVHTLNGPTIRAACQHYGIEIMEES